jgi:hypothetical protein
MGEYKDPPKSTEIKKEFGNILYSFFGHELKMDSTLRESCNIFIEEEVGDKEIKRNKNYAYFHQMWTLTDPLEMYKIDAFVESFNRAIHQDIYKNYFSRMEGESYWIEVIQKGDKYYLVVAVD